MKLLPSLAAMVYLVLATSTFATDQVPGKRFQLEIGVRSHVGAWILTAQDRPWLRSEDIYDTDELARRTSKVGSTFGPQMKATWGRWYTSAGMYSGNNSYSGGGQSTLTGINVEFGKANTVGRGRAHLGLVYQWMKVEVEDLDTVFANHTAQVLGLTCGFNSEPQSVFRYRFSGMIPLMLFRYLFDWQGAVEHEFIGSGELTFGLKPRRLPLFFDLGYGFVAIEHPWAVERKELVSSYTTFRHGVIAQVGWVL